MNIPSTSTIESKKGHQPRRRITRIASNFEEFLLINPTTRRGNVAYFASRTEAPFTFQDESTASEHASTSTSAIPISFPATDFQKALSSLDHLRSALVRLQSLQNKKKKSNFQNWTFVGEYFLPTKNLIAQQIIRLWNGVLLSDDVLDSSSTHNARGGLWCK